MSNRALATAPKSVARKSPASTVAPMTEAAPATTAAIAVPLATEATDQTPVEAHWKLVRDRFKMPAADFVRVATLKQRSLALQRPARKSELLRAGLLALTRLPDAEFFDILGGIVVPKAVRSKKRR